jgi:hypothetical protein
MEAAEYRQSFRLKPVWEIIRKVMAEGPNPKKKHLLHRLVKKVLIHCRKTVEIWYVLPNSQRFANCNIWLPICNSMRTRPGWVEPEVYFRIVHVAPKGHDGTPVAAYREQTVEITLGPKGAFESGNIGALVRRVSIGRVLSAAPLHRGYPIPSKVAKTPRVVEFLRKAIEWRRQIDAGEVRNQADIARREGVTRARVTQILGLLRLAPEIQETILAMPKVSCRPAITERALRSIVQ